MAMELSAQPRTQLGRAVKGLRKDGMVPAELYGHGIKNEHVAVSMKDLRKVLRHAGETSIVDLNVGGKKHPVFIHDVMYNPITDVIVAVDFYRVRMDEKMRIKVPLSFIGEPAGVKEKGGVLVRSLSELEVEGLPADIPHTIEVDLKALIDVGTSLHVSDLQVPSGVRVLVKPEFVVATITARMTEEQEQALAAKGADVSEIKTEGEEKKEQAATTEVSADGTPAAAVKPAAGKPGSEAPAKK